MVIENQRIIGHVDGAGAIRFRFCPKDAKLQRYTIEGNIPRSKASVARSRYILRRTAALHPGSSLAELVDG